MVDLLFIIPARNIDTLHRTLSMLSFQKDRSFRTCVVNLTGSDAAVALAADFEHTLEVKVVAPEPSGMPFWKQCLMAAPEAEWVCFLGTDVGFTSRSVGRMRQCVKDHPAYDAFHWNLAEPCRKYRLKTPPDKLFLSVVMDGAEAPLSSFVFRAQALRDAFWADPEAAGMDLAVIFALARKTGIRTVRRERIGYSRPAPQTDPARVEQEVRSRLAFLHWSERYFGDDYPLGVSERLALFAGELARLYPGHTPDELKADLGTFAVVNGPVRRLRAASALKTALKARQDALQSPTPENK